MNCWRCINFRVEYLHPFGGHAIYEYKCTEGEVGREECDDFDGEAGTDYDETH